MDIAKSIVKEFEIRVFEESFDRVKICIDLINENNLWESPNDEITSIGNSVLHICGNARQWICSAIGGEEDLRERNKEFKAKATYSKNELIEMINSLSKSLKRTLDHITTVELNKDYIIQGFSVSGFSAIIHVIEHVSYHTGQITLLTKLYTGKNTHYYDETNLTQRNSSTK